MTDQNDPHREEFSLAEMARILRAHARWVVGIPLVLVFVTLTVQLLTPRQWLASVVIKMGQIGSIAATGPATEYVEPIPRAIERMKQRAFQDAVLSNLGVPTDEKDPRASLYRQSLRIRQVDYGDTVDIRVRGFSADEAKRMAEATVLHLRDVHDQLARPSVERLKRQLAAVEEDRARILTEQERLLRRAEERNKAGVGFPERLLFDNMIYQMSVQRRDLELRALAYEENLGPLRTWETSALEPAFVGARPEARQTPLRVGLAGLLGLCLGGFVALLMNAFKSSAEPLAKGVASPVP